MEAKQKMLGASKMAVPRLTLNIKFALAIPVAALTHSVP
jgi:hypothetical protein